MKVYQSFHDITNDEGTFKLVEPGTFTDVLEEILAIDVLSDDIGMGFCVDGLMVFEYLGVIDYFKYLTLVSM
jgi:hypothetical protein